jgi:hypothetical protein
MSERKWMFYTETKDGIVSIVDDITYRKARKLYNETNKVMEERNLSRVGFSEIDCDVFSQQILRQKAKLATFQIS